MFKGNGLVRPSRWSLLVELVIFHPIEEVVHGKRLYPMLSKNRWLQLLQHCQSRQTNMTRFKVTRGREQRREIMNPFMRCIVIWSRESLVTVCTLIGFICKKICSVNPFMTSLICPTERSTYQFHSMHIGRVSHWCILSWRVIANWLKDEQWLG